MVAFDSSTINTLTVAHNNNLVDFEMANFTRISTGDTILFSTLAIVINNNNSLEHFNAFAQLHSIMFFEIRSNPKLEYLRGLDNVIKINRIEISFNNSLKEINVL